MAFIRTIENFVCEKCNAEIIGNGFTNHCPSCLWSKHVDIEPGDRKEKCGALMKPISLERRGQEYSLVHECIKCGVKKKNIISPSDDFQKVIEISTSRD